MLLSVRQSLPRVSQLGNCVAGPWSRWSPCEATCDNTNEVQGVRTRTRGVATPASNGGVECTLSQEGICFVPPCGTNRTPSLSQLFSSSKVTALSHSGQLGLPARRAVLAFERERRPLSSMPMELACPALRTMLSSNPKRARALTRATTRFFLLTPQLLF